MKKIYVSTKTQLDELYNQSALTWEGLATDEKNLQLVEGWLNEYEAIGEAEPTFYIITGKFMNETYDLTGNNAYPEDLNIVSITDINQMKIAIPRFRVGGRWFDDIVDNNARREQE